MAGPAVQHRLRGADGDDEIGLEERAVDAQWNRADLSELDRLRVLRVVDADRAREPAREARRHDPQVLERAAVGAAHQPGRDEKGLALGRNPGSLELRGGCLERFLARILLRSREWQRRRLDHDRRASAAGSERGQRLSGERKAERVTDGGSHVGVRLAPAEAA